MKHHPQFAWIVMLLALLPGCVVPLNPVTTEDRSVVAAKDANKTLTVIDGIVMTDSPIVVSRGIRFPAGTYVLEAEDAGYYYFASPEPLEYRIFKNGQAVDGRFIPGGIAFARPGLHLVAAAGYMSHGEGTKTLTWKLGAEFLALEGRYWRKSF
jgi:hypothetical protein